jgi:hypothetical protein
LTNIAGEPEYAKVLAALEAEVDKILGDSAALRSSFED